MSGADINLAAAALAIALVALVIAVGQLLQQYFATADGYRNCQKSVMGQWAIKTRRRFRWREFRFETLFSTPEIFLTGGGGGTRPDQVYIIGSAESRRLTLTPPDAFDDPGQFPRWPTHSSKSWSSAVGRREADTNLTQRKMTSLSHTMENPSDELVCWLPLLHWLHETTRASLDPEEQPLENATREEVKKAYAMINMRKRVPALVFRVRSWDFQPPDVSRPMARTTVSDIAVLARRMGMRWKAFRPEDGMMRAEGHSHILTSTVVRSLGLLLHYSYTGQARRLSSKYAHYAPTTTDAHKELEEIYIASPGAD